MRVLFIIAVLGILAHPAWAMDRFPKDDCEYLGNRAYHAMRDAEMFQRMAVNDMEANSNKPSQRFHELLDDANKSMEQSSNYANVYIAFCKD